MSASIDFKQLAVCLVDELKKKPAPDAIWLGAVPAAERDDIYLAMLSAAVKEDPCALVSIVADLVDKQRKRAEAAEQRATDAETRAAVAEQRLEEELLPAQLTCDIQRNEIRELLDQLQEEREQLAEEREELEALRIHASSENDAAAEEIFDLRDKLRAAEAHVEWVQGIRRDAEQEMEHLSAELARVRAELAEQKRLGELDAEDQDALRAELAQARLELENSRELVKEKLEELATANTAIFASASFIGRIQRMADSQKAEYEERHSHAVGQLAAAEKKVAELKEALTAAKAQVVELEAEVAFYRGDAYLEDDEEDTAPIGSEECGYLSDHGYGGADV